jgi:alpha-glucosidase
MATAGLMNIDKVLAIFALAAMRAANAQVTVASPNQQVEFRLISTAAGGLRYTVNFKGRTVIEDSPAGITVDGVNLAAGAETGKVEPYQVDEKYPWYGVHSTAVDHCRGVRIAMKHRASGSAYTLEIRAYDDGVAFRHIVPPAGRPRVPGEATAFHLPARSVVWYHDFNGHYEGVHQRKRLSDVGAGDWAAPPLTFELPNRHGFASITEGALFHYAGMGLQADGEGGFAARLGHAVPPSYPFTLRYKGEEERMAQPAKIDGEIVTPWRIVTIGADLNALVNSDIVHNVAPPPDPKLFPQGIRTPWIKPGRAVWAYLDGGGRTLDGMKQFSKQAGELGFEYNVLEGFWAQWPEAQLKELVDYSRQRGVNIMIWKHSKALRTVEQVREFFEICRRTGVVGAKIDFFDHEAKEVVERYEMILREAAQYHLVVDFHGANKPTGESRTWPNELTREGIRGLESRIPRAQHDATLPFTRMLAGHADYTPMHFGQRRNDTTWAHQIASAAIFTSPLLVYAANPENILKNPAVEMIKTIPSVWDETVALDLSEIGEVAALARRKGSTWFIAILNGTTGRTVDVPLKFLGGGKYQALEVRDERNPAEVKIEHSEVEQSSALRVELQPGGGYIARFDRR